MNATARWILIVVGLLAANALAMAFLVIASSTSPAQVIPDYYAKAARHDEAMASAARSRALGWQVAIEATPGTVAVVAKGADGVLLAGATVEMVLVPRAHADRTEHVALGPTGTGYRAAVKSAPGLHDATIVVEHGGRRYSQNVLVELP